MKKKLLAIIMSVLCFTAAVPCTTVLADGQKVVTLGADLSEEQKQAILRYFGISGQNIQTLTITNQDERDHLGAYVPLEQIGTRTYSCALVNPTASGGIQVKTANLSWVTSNMIATTLSTSGVVNCEVLAAAPFEVSGTGALTGILMAYESAVGATLDTAKKEVATQELITTTTIANTIGQAQATDLVNESKKQIIQGNVVNDNDINVVINEVAAQEGITLTDEDRELLADLMQQIAEQDYDYEDMQETLERVESNMDEYINSTGEDDADLAAPATADSPDSDITVLESGTDAAALASDSILMNTDDTALGSQVVFDATDDAALENAEITLQDVNDTVDTAVLPDDASEAPLDITVITDDQTVIPDATDVTVIETEAPSDAAVSDGSQTEAPIDAAVAGDSQTEVPEDAAISEEAGAEAVTLNLETIPLQEMEFAPLTAESTAYQSFQAGITELTVDIARNDMIPGNGTLTLYNAADSSVVETINMNDASKVTVAPLSDQEIYEYGWTAGSRAVITLANPLEQLSNYYAVLSADAFQTADGIGTTAAVEDSNLWTINTGEYGFYIKDTVKGITAGTPVSGQIMMDQTAAVYACIENADPALVTFDVTEFAESGSFTATFLLPGETGFQVSFYDEAGTCLNTIDYTVTVK